MLPWVGNIDTQYRKFKRIKAKIKKYWKIEECAIILKNILDMDYSLYDVNIHTCLITCSDKSITHTWYELLNLNNIMKYFKINIYMKVKNIYWAESLINNKNHKFIKCMIFKNVI